MAFEFTVGTVDPSEHRKAPHVVAKAKIIRKLLSDAKKVSEGGEVRRTLKYSDSAGRLDIAIYYGVDRIAPAEPNSYFQVQCTREQIVDVIKEFIIAQLSDDRYDSEITSQLEIFRDRTGEALIKARAARGVTAGI